MNSARDYITQTAIDLHVYETEFLPRLNDTLNVFFDFAYHDYAELWEARNYTDDSYSTYQHSVDLSEFLTKVAELDIAESLAGSISELQNTLEPLVIRSGHGPTHLHADSFAVYFPNALAKPDPLSPQYWDLAFTATLWDEFLNQTKSPTKIPAVLSHQGPTIENTTGPYSFSIDVEGSPGAEVELHYRINGGAWQVQQMTHSSVTYRCMLTGQPNGTVIDFYYLVRDSGREITEPYDMKWTGTDFHQVEVAAYGDVAITGFSVVPGALHNDTLVTLTVECVNHGPQDVTANVSVNLSSAGQFISLGYEIIELSPGAAQDIDFSWTALNGTWLASVYAEVLGKADVNATNQNSTVWLEVTPLDQNLNSESLGDLYYILAFMIIITMVPVLVFIVLMRKARRRRRSSVAKVLRSARQFIATTEEFDVDATASYMLLAKAEVAYSQGRFNEAERLASQAKESAILAVGGRENQP
jgi:hypothetical protein